VQGPETEVWLAFRTALRELESRIKVFTALPIESLDRMTLQARLQQIGRSPAGPA
jgi:arsenate reductase